MKLKRISNTDFERVAKTTRIKDRTRDMLREVLVDGVPQTDAATKYGVTKQRVNLLVGTIEKAYMQGPSSADSIVSVTLDLPETLALELSMLLEALERCKSGTKVARTIAQVVDAITEKRKMLAE